MFNSHWENKTSKTISDLNWISQRKWHFEKYHYSTIACVIVCMHTVQGIEFPFGKQPNWYNMLVTQIYIFTTNHNGFIDCEQGCRTGTGIWTTTRRNPKLLKNQNRNQPFLIFLFWLYSFHIQQENELFNLRKARIKMGHEPEPKSELESQTLNWNWNINSYGSGFRFYNCRNSGSRFLFHSRTGFGSWFFSSHGKRTPNPGYKVL